MKLANIILAEAVDGTSLRRDGALKDAALRELQT